jgi:hypothetical protein
MSRQRAVLVLDPQRREQQIAFIAERDPNYLEFGDHVWAMLTEDQADVFSRQGILVQFQSEANVVEVPAGFFRPPEEVPQPPEALTAVEPTGSNRAYYIVLFIASLPEFVNGVTELGAELIDDLPGPAVIFKMTSEQATQVRALPYVVWVGLYHPAYALHYDLAGSAEPLNADAIGRIAVDPTRVVETPEGNLKFVPFSDVGTTALRPAVEIAGATVVNDVGYALLINASAERVPQLLRIPGLHALEREIPMEFDSQRSSIIIGADQVRNFRRTDFLVNLDGTGEIVHITDSGLDNGNGFPLHPDLAGRVILPITNVNGAAVTADFQIHGTHVAGCVAGDGTTARAAGTPTTPTGTAPAAQIFFSALTTGLPVPPAVRAPVGFANFLAGFVPASAAGARVHTNSYGNDNNNTYTNNRSAQVDRFCFLNPEDVVLFSAGNNEGDYNNDGRLDLNRLSDLACSKNVITIGACENDTALEGIAITYAAFFGARHANAGLNPLNLAAPVLGNFPFSDNPNETALFSERGRVVHANPALRRVKPDLVAPGTNIVSLGRIVLPPPGPAGGPGQPLPPAVSAPPASYAITSGTSMATPLVAGCCAQVRQFYRSLFGQLRHPVQMEVITSFVDNPSVAPHRDGVAICWVRPGGATNDIVAARFTPELVRQGAIVVLQTNVGADPAPVLAQSGDNTLLLHRASDNSLRLSLYDRNLASVGTFGGNAPAPAGVVILSPNSRTEDDRRPTLCVRETEVAVAWMQTGTDNLLFQRFRTDNGQKIDANPLTLGSATNTSPNQYLIHNGTRYAAVWARLTGGNNQVLMRFVENNGTLAGAAPLTLVTQAPAIRSPHAAWNPRFSRYRLVWVSDDSHAGGDIMSQRFNADGSPDPLQPASRIVTVPATNAVRQPLIQLHPTNGYTVLWEDNTQASQGHAAAPAVNSFDVYLNFLDDFGIPDGRISGNRQQLSDTPNDTVGFSAFTGDGGIFTAWNSNDEINSDVSSVYAVRLTLQGAFAAQFDTHTPLLDSGRYVAHRLQEHDAVDQPGMALAWAGGPYFHLQLTHDRLAINCLLVRTTADGLPDLTYGGTGSRRITFFFAFEGLAILWADTRLIVAVAHPVQFELFLFDANGTPEATFGTNGRFSFPINEHPTPAVNPQLGFNGTGNSFRMFVAWANIAVPKPMLRAIVLDRTATAVMAARDLEPCDGTARHGWFHFVQTENRAIAVWHEQVGGSMVIRLNRYNFSNPVATMREHNPALTLATAAAGPTNLPGNSQNPVLAPRPVLFDPPFPASTVNATQSRQREYGLAFQNQPPGGNWQLRFSRLQRNGTLGGVVNQILVTSPTDHCTDPQLVWHTNGYGLAWLQQLAAGGPHRLMFTVIDQSGANRAPANYQVSSATADVQQFQLVWNGRSFRVGWTEVEGGVMRQMQSALALPRMALPVGFNQPYQHPSAALVRATLINGATNYNNTQLPNVPIAGAGQNANDGYGWGRVNMRQSLAPAQPVTFFVRDDSSVAAGRTVRYEFTLPPDTRLLRVTLVWTDPPGNALVNNLNLRMTTPPFPPGGARIYVGNRWQTGATPQFSDPLPAVPPANPFETVHPIEQIVIPGAPTLPAGTYIVEVIAGAFNTAVLQQHPGQPFSLVFVGSGAEWPLVLPTGLAAAGGLPFF